MSSLQSDTLKSSNQKISVTISHHTSCYLDIFNKTKQQLANNALINPAFIVEAIKADEDKNESVVVAISNVSSATSGLFLVRI